MELQPARTAGITRITYRAKDFPSLGKYVHAASNHHSRFERHWCVDRVFNPTESHAARRTVPGPRGLVDLLSSQSYDGHTESWRTNRAALHRVFGLIEFGDGGGHDPGVDEQPLVSASPVAGHCLRAGHGRERRRDRRRRIPGAIVRADRSGTRRASGKG